MSVFPELLLPLVAIGGAAALFSRLSRTDNKPLASAPCCGLANLGNTCFCNSVLQALASMDCLLPFVETLPTSGLRDSLALLLSSLRAASKHATLHPGRVLAALDSPLIDRGQQDAQELYMLLAGLLVPAAPRPMLEHLRSPQPLALRVAPFAGLLASRLCCTVCASEPVIRHSSFNCLSVPLASASETTLCDCLQAFVALEHIADARCRFCSLNRTRKALPKSTRLRAQLRFIEKALKNENAALPSDIPLKQVESLHTKQLMVARAPQMLVVHLIRSSVLSFRMQKNTCRVSFPLVLDIAPFCTSGSFETDPFKSMRREDNGSEILYALKAVVVHSGSLNYGHYAVYRWNSGVWVYASDEFVREASEAEVMECGEGAFMFFYERVK